MHVQKSLEANKNVIWTQISGFENFIGYILAI